MVRKMVASVRCGLRFWSGRFVFPKHLLGASLVVFCLFSVACENLTTSEKSSSDKETFWDTYDTDEDAGALEELIPTDQGVLAPENGVFVYYALDWDDEPIAGAAVVIDGYPGTVTDAEGRFEVPDIGFGNDVEFSVQKDGYDRSNTKDYDLSLGGNLIRKNKNVEELFGEWICYEASSMGERIATPDDTYTFSRDGYQTRKGEIRPHSKKPYKARMIGGSLVICHDTRSLNEAEWVKTWTASLGYNRYPIGTWEFEGDVLVKRLQGVVWKYSRDGKAPASAGSNTMVVDGKTKIINQVYYDDEDGPLWVGLASDGSNIAVTQSPTSGPKAVRWDAYVYGDDSYADLQYTSGTKAYIGHSGSVSVSGKTLTISGKLIAFDEATLAANGVDINDLGSVLNYLATGPTITIAASLVRN